MKVVISDYNKTNVTDVEILQAHKANCNKTSILENKKI